ncbi:Ankyrin repeat domain-containing 2-like protein [Quillaja saponaria]|uniref:Ankyrin repeat domain-containing 2-like protein n=1 Tax=Quillaja saponaria TaxID=32244 RepID=A0AAD7QFR7_QUISA|nr:Ankyrin repeat domain-containing 2-like protein [Quillaja saponaria]
MAEQLQNAFQGASMEEGIPHFDNQQYYHTMQQVVQNPQFMTMVECLDSKRSFIESNGKTTSEYFQGASVEEGIPHFDDQHYYHTMQQVVQDPQFMAMVEHLGSIYVSMLESFTNLTSKGQLKERMACIEEDPSLKHILKEIQTSGPTAMTRYWNDKEVLQ